MVIKEIYYGQDFLAQFKRLPKDIQKITVAKEAFFQDNPLHPSLRLHALKGKLKDLWSISITLNYRIIFKRVANGDIIFISIGKHDLYSSF